MRSFKKVVITTLVMGTLSSAGAALAVEGPKSVLPKLGGQERRPVAQVEKPKPPVNPEGQQKMKRPEHPKDGKRRPPVSGDIRKDLRRPEPPKDKDGNPLPPPQRREKPENN